MFCQLNYRSLSVIRFMSESTGAKLYGHSAVFLRGEKFFVENCVFFCSAQIDCVELAYICNINYH